MNIAINENDSQYKIEEKRAKFDKSLIFVKRKPEVSKNSGFMVQ